MLGQIADQTQRPHGSERLVFKRIVDLQSPLAAVLEKRLDELGLMVHGHRDAAKTATRKLTYDDFEDRKLADRHQGLRKHHRVWPQTRPSAASEDYSSFRHCRVRLCSARDFPDAATIRSCASAPRAGILADASLSARESCRCRTTTARLRCAPAERGFYPI